jgi:SAM-dependent methyltransferase
MLARYPTAKRTHLDVACGTGLAMDFFRSRGWRSVGIDASLAMLQLAQGTRVAADMRALPFRASFARVTCLYDSLNHMLDRKSLVAAFRAVRAVMADDALFFFDVNHPEIYPEVWGASDPFVSVGREHHLEIATTYRPRDRRATAMVTGWAVVGGRRVEIREQHRQRAWSEREIRSALAEARLAAVEVMHFDPYLEPVNAPTVKLFFVARPTSPERPS